MNDPHVLILIGVIAVLLSPIVLVAGLWFLIRKYGGRTLRVLAACALLCVVFVPSFVLVGDSLIPVPPIQALVALDDNRIQSLMPFALALLPGPVAWLIQSIVQLVRPLRWPQALSSPRALATCGLASPGVIALGLFFARRLPNEAAGRRDDVQSAVAGLVIWLSTVAVGWSALLLLQTRRTVLPPTSRTGHLRAWLVACLLTGCCGWLVGLGIGIMVR